MNGNSQFMKVAYLIVYFKKIKHGHFHERIAKWTKAKTSNVQQREERKSEKDRERETEGERYIYLLIHLQNEQMKNQSQKFTHCQEEKSNDANAMPYHYCKLKISHHIHHTRRCDSQNIVYSSQRQVSTFKLLRHLWRYYSLIQWNRSLPV